MNLEKLLEFNKLLLSFREVERVLFVKGKDERENDMEHSFQLALLGWYIASSNGLTLKIDLLIKYALAHDLVEVYAGDTDVFTKDVSLHANKHEREEKALERIKKEFPEFVELHSIIEGYEKREDAESKFIYALDKLVPVLNIFEDGGRTWSQRGITFEMLMAEKISKVAVSQVIDEYFQEFKKILEDNKTELFAQ